MGHVQKCLVASNLCAGQTGYGAGQDVQIAHSPFFGQIFPRHPCSLGFPQCMKGTIWLHGRCTSIWRHKICWSNEYRTPAWNSNHLPGIQTTSLRASSFFSISWSKPTCVLSLSDSMHASAPGSSFNQICALQSQQNAFKNDACLQLNKITESVVNRFRQASMIDQRLPVVL